MSLCISRMVVGMVRTNCYLVYEKDKKEAVIIDPGDRALEIVKKVESLGIVPRAIFLTHGHGDHMMAVPPLKEQYQIPVYAHEAEGEVLSDPSKNLSQTLFGKSLSFEADVYGKDGEILSVGGMDFQVIFTPGHTCGSCCYYLKEQKVLFSGDTLFCESLGRTDFPTGSTSAICRSIREKLFVLPEEVKVCPGHMDPTTIGHEKEYNPVSGM